MEKEIPGCSCLRYFGARLYNDLANEEIIWLRNAVGMNGKIYAKIYATIQSERKEKKICILTILPTGEYIPFGPSSFVLSTRNATWLYEVAIGPYKLCQFRANHPPIVQCRAPNRPSLAALLPL